jgi:F420-dependent oxidoreductase-like protein
VNVAKLSFGIKTAPQHVTYEQIVAIWKEADSIPAFEHAWLFDHFAPIQGDLDGPCLEGWTVLAALAAETKRIRLGLMVTGNTYRHPAVLAKIAATLDVISNGRLDFGIGAGWNVYEHDSMGLELGTPGPRIRKFGEACDIFKSLFTEHLTTFEGKYYTLKDARCEPKPVQKPYPPFVIGGSGEQLTLRIVAKHANIWNFGGGDAATFTHKVNVLNEHCAAIGRDPSEIQKSIQIQVFPDDMQKTIDTVQELVDVGATHIILNIRPPHVPNIVARCAEEIVPKIRS